MALLLSVVVFVCYCSVGVVAASAGADRERCAVPMSLRLIPEPGVWEEERTNVSRVQVCEDNSWKNLCDSDWTESDAIVACRTLGYSPIGAKNSTQNLIIGGYPSSIQVRCNGSENHISDCDYTMASIRNCRLVIKLQCFTSDYHPSSGSTNQVPNSFSASVPTTSTTQQHTQPQSSTNSDGSDSGSGNFNSILKPPYLYYFILGVAAVVVSVMLLLLVIITVCCCRRSRSKEVSPYDVDRQNAFTKEKNTSLRLEVPAEESTKIKDGLMHHQLQQSSPIYDEADQNASTPHSQESCSSRSSVVTTNGPPPPLPLQGSELYSVLISTGTYSELEVHIPIAAFMRAEQPSSDSYYQQLNHNTSSLKQHRAPSIHTVNRSTVAVAQGLPEEEEFLEQNNIRSTAYTSISLPARDSSLSCHRPLLLQNRSLERPNLQVLLRDDDCDCDSGRDHNSDQEIFYKPIESPLNYASLRGLDEGSEVSTNGTYNKSMERNRLVNGIGSSHPLSCQSPSIPERPSSSGPVPILRTSSRSSPTFSLTSNSAQICRAANGSLLVSGGYVKPRIANKYSKSPELTRKNNKWHPQDWPAEQTSVLV